MVREFLMRTPLHSCMTPPPISVTPPVSECLVSPLHSARIGTEHITQNGTDASGHHEKTKAALPHGRRSLPQISEKIDPEDMLLERVASELYHCQENPLPLDISRMIRHPSDEEEEAIEVQGGAESPSSEEQPDVVSPASAPSPSARLRSRNSYEELLTMLDAPSGQNREHPHFRPKLETVVVQSMSVPNKSKSHGFLSMQRRQRNPLLSREQHFSDFSRMSESYGYEGPPSPQLQSRFTMLTVEECHKEAEERGGAVGQRGDGGGAVEEGRGERAEGEGGRERCVRRGTRIAKKFIRKTAIRRQRRKVGGSGSEPPPDTSYSLHVSTCTKHALYTASASCITSFVDIQTCMCVSIQHSPSPHPYYGITMVSHLNT